MKKLLILFNIAVLLVMSSFEPGTGYKVGDTVADFKLKNVDGKMVSLKDMESAKGFIVTFTCNHCPFSIAYEDRIIDLHNTYVAKGYPVIAINPNDVATVPDDSFEKMQERAREKKFPFVYLHDETQNIAKQFGAARTPHMYILQKTDKGLVVKYIGAIDDNTDDPSAVTKPYLKNAMEALLAGKDPEVNFTKAIGCTIKWKK
jgi:peroxiredoxin